MNPASPHDWTTERSAWRQLAPGMHITVVKLAPDGAEAARYPGEVIASRGPGEWIIVRATWTYRQVDLEGLSFVPGDVLLEWFSPTFPFNAFAILSRQGDFRGWYANVAHPARLAAVSGELVLTWHDLYLDLVGLPDGRWSLLDEDELRRSGLKARDPSLLSRIEAAAAELQRRFGGAEIPFVAQRELRTLLNCAEVRSNAH